MRIKYVKLSPHAVTPLYATPGSAGADLSAYLPERGDYIGPGEIKKFHTGLVAEIPENTEIQIRSRSSLAALGLSVAGGVCTVDSDYRGEIMVMLHNTSNKAIKIMPNDRIAQAIACKFEQITWEREETVDALHKTKRNKGAFGSTGK